MENFIRCQSENKIYPTAFVFLHHGQPGGVKRLVQNLENKRMSKLFQGRYSELELYIYNRRHDNESAFQGRLFLSAESQVMVQVQVQMLHTE